MRLVVHDLAHRFPGTDLLFEHLDMTVDPGMTVAVCGPSGCGKSTLLSILAGWEKPYAGSVERIGIARTGWVFQNPVGVAQRRWTTWCSRCSPRGSAVRKRSHRPWRR